MTEKSTVNKPTVSPSTPPSSSSEVITRYYPFSNNLQRLGGECVAKTGIPKRHGRYELEEGLYIQKIPACRFYRRAQDTPFESNTHVFGRAREIVNCRSRN